MAFTIPGWPIGTAFFSLLFGAGLALLPASAPARWASLPGMLVAVEALRGRWPFGGAPVSSIAYGQVAGIFAPVARIGGGLLLIGVTAAAGVALAMAMAGRWRPALLVTAGVVLAALAGAVAPDGRPTGRLAVAVVQGGGPQGTRADDTDEREVFERHLAASALVDDGVDLVVWPEDVVDTDGPVTEAREGDELATLARQLDAVLVVGTVEGDTVGGEDRFHNAAVAFSPEGQVVDRFEKVRRVPFGEFTPLRWLLEPLAGGSLIDSEAIPGKSPAVLDTPVGRLGVVISWEVFFADRARDAIGNGGEVLLNPTNGASFHTTLVQSQQVASSRLRAIETGRWVLQAAPTGFSAIITPNGRVVDRTGISERAVLHGTVDRRTGQTIATRVGDWLALALAAGSIAGGWALHRRTPARRREVSRARERLRPG